MAGGRHTVAWRRAMLERVAPGVTVSQVAGDFGIARVTVYKFLKRVKGRPKSEWDELLKDRPKRGKTHGQQTTDAQRKVILDLAAKHPAWGCAKIRDELTRRRITRSANTVQKILNAEGLTSVADRARALDCKGGWNGLTLEQRSAVKKVNAHYRDYGRLGTALGSILFCARVEFGNVPGLARVHLYIVVESLTGFIFASLRPVGNSKHAIWLLDEKVVPKLKGHTCWPKSELIVSPTFWIKENEDVQQWITTSKATVADARPKERQGYLGDGFVSGFVDAFNRSFVGGSPCNEPFDNINDARKAFKTWLTKYNNTEQVGYPNFGKSPAAAFAAR